MRSLMSVFKPELQDLRNEMARGYRDMRRTNPAKAREIRRLMKNHIRQIEDECVAHLHWAPERMQ